MPADWGRGSRGRRSGAGGSACCLQVFGDCIVLGLVQQMAALNSAVYYMLIIAWGATILRHLADILGRHVTSIDGPMGMARLLERVNKNLPALRSAWNATDSVALTVAFERCASECDEYSLRDMDYALRADIAADPTAMGHDLYVRSSLYWALLEYLCEGEGDLIVAFVTTLYARARLTSHSTGYTMGILLARLYLDKNMPVEAEAVAKKNLSVNSSEPYAQYMLYLALAKQKAAGLISGSNHVAIDDLTGRFCSEPFVTLGSKASRVPGSAPELYACGCPGLLPFPVSDGSTSQSPESIWNGQNIQEIRRSIHDGDFKYCSRLACPALLGGNLPKKKDIHDPDLIAVISGRKTVVDYAPKNVSLSHDPSCNLACPSCRTELILIKNDQRLVLDEFADRIVLPLIEDAPVTLVLSLDGDPFASKHYRKILRSLDPVRHSQVKIQILTNGLLLTRREWKELSNIHGMVQSIAVSIDAAEPETYEDLRRPGKWSVLNDNMEFIGELRRSGQVQYFSANYVIQQKNFRQIPNFIRLGKHWGVDLIRFLKMINIGSFTADEFIDNDVCDPRHPEYQDFLAVLRDPIVSDPIADLYTAKPYLDEALKTTPTTTEVPEKVQGGLIGRALRSTADVLFSRRA